MPRIEYVPHSFRGHTLELIHQADAICREYAAMGITITLRQLFYQFVARDLMKNSQKEYKRLGATLNNARLAGYLDWNHMQDITRMLRGYGHDTSPENTVGNAAESFFLDKWETQENYVEVWIEKDAIVSVVAPVCNRHDVPFLSCRGYTSQSELWRSAARIRYRMEAGKRVTIIHLGDHDPSGIDMTRDIQDRVNLFTEYHIGETPALERIALNMDQIRQYNPPPNPAKMTDSRFKGYAAIHGNRSWELDSMDPKVMDGLISDTITQFIDQDALGETIAEEARMREELTEISRRYDDVVEFTQVVNDDLWPSVQAFAEDPQGAAWDLVGSQYDDYRAFVKNRPRYVTDWLVKQAEGDEKSLQWLL